MAKTPQKPASVPADGGTDAPIDEKALIASTTGALQTTGESVDYSEFVTDDVEHFQKDDLAIPFCSIAQANSPELKRQNEEKFIQGCVVGDLFNTVTRKVWPGFEDSERGVTAEQAGIFIVPVAYMPSYTQWFPRDSKQGKGFVKDWGTDASIMDKTFKDPNNKNLPMMKNGDGTYIQDASLYYILAFRPEDPDTVEWMALSLKGTQRKKAKQWNTIRQNLTFTPPNGRTFKPAPYFWHYHLTTKFEQNDKGDWYGYNIELVSYTAQNTSDKNKIGKGIPLIETPGGRNIYEIARDFSEVIKSGGVKVDHTATGPADDEGNGTTTDAF